MKTQPDPMMARSLQLLCILTFGAWLAACAGSATSPDAGPADASLQDGDAASDTKGDPDPADEIGPCELVDCGPHGTCTATDDQAACSCDPGWHAQGLVCEADDPRLPTDLSISQLAAFQAVKVPLYIEGVPIQQYNAPLLAGRDLLLRIYVKPGPGFTAREINAVLSTQQGDPIQQSLWIESESSDEDANSTINLLLPAAQVNDQTQFAIRLVDENGVPTPAGQVHPARFPQDGSLFDLQAEQDGGGIELVLVPVEYNTDGTGRLPDLGAEQLGIIEDLLGAAYPTSTISINIHEPLAWNESLEIDFDFRFGRLNQVLVDLKASDNASSKTYYYGLVRPADTFADYCFWTCTTGQGFVVDEPADGDIRVGSGLGFSGERWAWTLLHELGHQHGLGHAPCNTTGEAGYPYPDGDTGVWGFDPRSSSFLDPAHKDLMGYCDERWISDYNFSRLFERIQAVNQLGQRHSGSRMPFRFLEWELDSPPRWGRLVHIERPRTPNTIWVAFVSQDGKVLQEVAAPWIPYGNGPQGCLLIPTGPDDSQTVRIHDPSLSRTAIVSLP